MPDCSILSIGRELLLGQTVDTNAAWLSAYASGIGYRMRRFMVIDDDLDSIISALRQLTADSDVLLVTGGLGPTPDDLTREGLARASGVELVYHEELMEQVRARFARFGRPVTESNRAQAFLPAGAAALVNTCGTAPGVDCKIGRCAVFAMPGVPSEMKVMFESGVLPQMRAACSGQVRYMKRFHIHGVGEGRVGEAIKDAAPLSPACDLGTMVNGGIVILRAMTFAPTLEEAEQKTAAACEVLRQRFCDSIFAEDGGTLAESVVRGLIASGKTVALAESCTGGLVAAELVDVPGASAVLLEGIVCYSNASKTRRLGVDEQLLMRHGAVSREVVIALARGVRERGEADYGVAVTGIAGPGGGTPEKPVGTVWFAVATADGVYTMLNKYIHDRAGNRNRAVNAALDFLRRVIEGLPVPEGCEYASN